MVIITCRHRHELAQPAPQRLLVAAKSLLEAAKGALADRKSQGNGLIYLKRPLLDARRVQTARVIAPPKKQNLRPSWLRVTEPWQLPGPFSLWVMHS